MDLLPAGHYRAMGIPVDTDAGQSWAQFGETKGQKPYVAVNFEILDGPHAGRRITWFGYFTDKTVNRTVESLRYCGFTGDDLAAATYMPLEQEVQLVVGHETYEGKTSARVQWVNRPGGGGFKLEKPMDKGGLARFAAQMKGAVRSVAEAPGKKGERGAAPAGGQQQQPQPNDFDQRPPADDEIPF